MELSFVEDAVVSTSNVDWSRYHSDNSGGFCESLRHLRGSSMNMTRIFLMLSCSRSELTSYPFPVVGHGFSIRKQLVLQGYY